MIKQNSTSHCKIFFCKSYGPFYVKVFSFKKNYTNFLWNSSLYNLLLRFRYIRGPASHLLSFSRKNVSIACYEPLWVFLSQKERNGLTYIFSFWDQLIMHKTYFLQRSMVQWCFNVNTWLPLMNQIFIQTKKG